MKLLRNPVVVGALAVIAVVVVGIQLWPHLMPSSTPTRPDSGALPTPARAVTPPPLASSETPQKAPPGASIDIQAVEINSMRWNTTLQKDPFQIRTSMNQSTNPPARDLLTLYAVWRQTAGDLAVINNRIVIPGDRVLMFSVSRIEPDAVWVDGPNGPERIEFTGGVPAKTGAGEPPKGAPAPVKPKP